MEKPLRKDWQTSGKSRYIQTNAKRVADTVEGEREQLEGVITAEGEAELREAQKIGWND